MLDVADYADDLRPLFNLIEFFARGVVDGEHALAQRVFAAKEGIGHALRDDRRRFGGLTILVVEIAACSQRDVHGPKVIGADDAVTRIAGLILWPARDTELAV